jgi:predicted LPLAT superfamily acyltransferase
MAWRSVPEAGTILGIRIVAGTYRLFGRTLAGALLWCIAWYFTLFGKAQRTSAQDYFKRVGLPPTLSNVHALIWRFARVGLDRLLFLMGDIKGLTFEHFGHDDLVAAVNAKKGALLVGSHLGSFEAMRTLAEKYDVPLLVLADFANAQKVNSILQQLTGNVRFRLLELKQDDPLSMLQVKEAIDRGELVAMLGDRRTDREGRDVIVDFLGGKAKLPTGPYVLAHILQCPVYFVAGIYDAPSKYELHCVPLSERIELPRKGRNEAVEREAARYAQKLEEFTRRAPLNWFNFFPFWLDS